MARESLTALMVAGLLVSAPAYATAQKQAGRDCQPAQAPEKIEGQVTKVDTRQGRVTVRDASGATHEFQASPETLKDLKPGDRLETQLRSLPKC